MVVIEFRHLIAEIASGQATLRAGGHDLLAMDRVLVRGIPPGSLEQVVFRMDALHRLRLRGVPVLNPPHAIEACVDKYLTTARLQAAGLPVPRTVVCEGVDNAMAAFADLGGDVVVKPLFGSEGRGIARVSDEGVAYRVFYALTKLPSILYLQEFIEHPGHDHRLFILGDRVLAAMIRSSTTDFRTNVSRGGRFHTWTPPPTWADLALRAARAVGAPLAGVDLLTNVRGEPLIVEVNSTPGFQAIAQTTSVNVAREILLFLATGQW